ncbi:uncharacterized protein LOC132748913 [Ruditapes philippinarum]|uniref:uncharacterized protein LOC132748913 n=1 Tax=Ruditapes philippinarum TaxID=129788 RepID=UPI00295B1410|nr:uncharacterized protein LOC132748913 [Ruditapes philippinarum]
MNYMNEKDDRFLTFRKCLDAQMKYVTSKGIGANIKQADPVSAEQEELLWCTGKFGYENAESLLNAVFFYNCKLFGMRGRDEHYNLESDQFIISEDDGGKFIQFIGRDNKTFKGGLKHKKVENKNIKHYSSDKIYKVYQDYTSLLGDDVVKFYKRPIKDTKRLSAQVLGKNKLENMMKNICSGLEGNFTNQSGKRTCATTLYQAGVCEQTIMDRTGHRSVQGVRKYKRPSCDQLRDISNVLDSKKQMVSSTVTSGELENNSLVDLEKPKKLEMESPIQKIFEKDAKTFYNNCVFNFGKN